MVFVIRVVFVGDVDLYFVAYVVFDRVSTSTEASWDAVQVPATSSTACGEDQVLTGGNRCVSIADPPD